MTAPKITIASYITLSRFILVPVFIYFFWKKNYPIALATLGIAALTDLADGFIARRFNLRSRLGSLLDPAADKFLMIISFVFLSWQGRIPWNLTYVVLGKDFLVIAGVCVLNLMKIRLYYRPTILSKVTTASQISVLILSFAEVLLNPLGALSSIQNIAILWTGAITLATAGQYIFIGYKFYRFGERKT
ncbi:MAG: CDP-alcohol phosphatidyltransferase family protein [Deltaproteobacteria bacterium]|nr:CDP-alcohol phosphatidyltransferase family protein [Deltaproteobacteria bacterium]